MNRFALLVVPFLGLVGLALGCGQSAPVSPPTAAKAAPAPVPVVVDNWPGWRGPDGNGHSRSISAPVKFSADQNCLWSADVPGTGHSSPIVVDDRVYLTSADERAEVQRLLVYDRVTGRLLRDRPVHRGHLGPRHSENTHASSTPAWAGNRLLMLFVNAEGLHLTAASREGSILWQKQVSSYKASEGFGASPVVWKSRVIVSGDSSNGSLLAAYEQATGREVWRTERPKMPTFASPCIVRAAGRDQLLLHGAREICSYDPENGKLLWRCEGPWDTTCDTMCAFENLVFCSGGVPNNATIAVRAEPGLDASERIAWQTTDRFYVPSLTVHDGRLFGVTDTGIALALNARTGEELWRERLGGNFFASPVLVGDVAYVPNTEGTLFLFRPHADRLEIVARNLVGDGCYASPAICDGQVFVRTRSHLHCFGDSGSPPLPVGAVASER